jgi:hypothetical protein
MDRRVVLGAVAAGSLAVVSGCVTGEGADTEHNEQPGESLSW